MKQSTQWPETVVRVSNALDSCKPNPGSQKMCCLVTTSVNRALLYVSSGGKWNERYCEDVLANIMVLAVLNVLQLI